MRLQFVTISDRGVPNMERIHLSVLMESDASYYVIIYTAVAANAAMVGAGSRVAYWFHGKQLKPGDNVVLYTCAGTESTDHRVDGGSNHFFFWGAEKTMFNHPSSSVVLAELNAWQTGL